MSLQAKAKQGTWSLLLTGNKWLVIAQDLVSEDPQFPQMETWGWAFEQILCHAFESESGQSDACDTRAVPIQCYRTSPVPFVLWFL